jgi:hypothetical protein
VERLASPALFDRQLEEAIKTLNPLWNDTIMGQTCNLGYLFLGELLTGEVSFELQSEPQPTVTPIPCCSCSDLMH